jgi:hypothetical protein
VIPFDESEKKERATRFAILEKNNNNNNNNINNNNTGRRRRRRRRRERQCCIKHTGEDNAVFLQKDENG